MNDSNSPTYDFSRCKLCGKLLAQPTYRLAGHWIYACSDCDFHFLDQLDSVIEKEKKLTNSSRRYIEIRAGEGAALHPARLALLQNHSRNTGDLLDIGAGIGQFQQLATAQGYTCCAIEPSPLRRQYAAEKFNLKLSPQLINDNYWQKDDRNYFDAITFWDVIEHVNFPRETLSAAVKVLKPGGVILLDTPSRNVLAYRISEKIYRLSDGKISGFLSSFYSAAPYGHKQIFTPKQLIDLLCELGLSITGQQKSYKIPTKGNRIILVAQKSV